jgi:hypothetical protein
MLLWEEAMRVHAIFGATLGKNMNLWSFWSWAARGFIAWRDTQNIWRSSKVSVFLVMLTSSISSSWLCFALKNPPQWWWSSSSWFCFGLKNPSFDGDGILFAGSNLIYHSHHDGSLHFGYVLVLKNPPLDSDGPLFLSSTLVKTSSSWCDGAPFLGFVWSYSPWPSFLGFILFKNLLRTPQHQKNLKPLDF